MKPPKIDLRLKRLARESYLNAVRLLQDSCILFEDGSLASSYYLALSSIEELGKVKMIDHFYADMRVNNEFLGHPKDLFINSLLSKQNFYNHAEKHSIALDGLVYFDNTNNLINKDLIAWFQNPEKERQGSIYVDWSNGYLSIPSKRVTRLNVKAAIELALQIVDDMEDMGLAGTYWVGSSKTKRRAKAILEELNRVYRRKRSLRR